MDADKISLGSYYVWPLETVLNRDSKNIRSTIEGARWTYHLLNYSVRSSSRCSNLNPKILTTQIYKTTTRQDSPSLKNSFFHCSVCYFERENGSSQQKAISPWDAFFCRLRERGGERRAYSGAVPPRIIYNLGLGGPSGSAVTLTHFHKLSGLEGARVQPQATVLI